MERNQFIHELIKEIEWFPKIEVIVYATLKIKKCSYFYYPDKLRQICDEHNFDIRRFYAILEKLDLAIQKNFFITVADWPNYDFFDKRYHVESSCRKDNVEGLFLDIPACCATTYAEQGNIRDRAILRKYPFRGISIPEQLDVIYPNNEKEQEEWWKEFRQHFIDHENDVRDYSEEVKQRVEKMITAKKLPQETWLLFSTFTPCAPKCGEFFSMADKMNSALKTYLSHNQYCKIINDYISGKKCL